MGKSFRIPAFFREVVSGTPTSIDLDVTDSERNDPATFIVQVYRAGVLVSAEALVTYDEVDGILTIANNGTFAFESGDVINAVVSFGEKQATDY